MKTSVTASLTAILLSGILPPCPVSAQESPEKNAYEWVIETYPFPARELSDGFASEERGALKAPLFPEGQPSEEAEVEFLRKSNSIVAHFLKKQGISLPQGSVVVFDPGSRSLAVRAPRIVQSSIAFASSDFRAGTPTYLEMNTVLLEGAAATIRAEIAKAGESSDHSALLQSLEAAADAGTVTILHRGRVESRSGQRAKIDSSKEVVSTSSHQLMPDGMLLYGSETYREGTIWEFDTVVGADESTIDLNLSLQHHYAPSAKRPIPFATIAKGTASSTVVEHSVANINSSFTLTKGMTKLVGVWKAGSLPVAPDAPDRLQAGFITVDLIEVLPLPNPRLSELLGKHANAIAAIPDGAPIFEKVAEEIPEGMIVRRFRIPPTFLSSQSAGGGAADPFAEPAAKSEPTFTIKATARDILMSAGIPFPAGSSANYLPGNSTLVIRNTPENIALVEAYVMSIQQGAERTMGITAHVIEGPSAKIRNLVAATHGLANHIGAWTSTGNDPEIRQIASYWIGARSGERSKLTATKDFIYPTTNHIVSQLPAAGEKVNDAAPMGTISGTFEAGEVGGSLEVDPVLGADESTVDIHYGFTFDYAEPSTKPEPARGDGNLQLDGPETEFHRANLIGQTTVLDGMTRLIGYWKPNGTGFEGKDLLQAVFLKVDVIPLFEEDAPAEP